MKTLRIAKAVKDRRAGHDPSSKVIATHLVTVATNRIAVQRVCDQCLLLRDAARRLGGDTESASLASAYRKCDTKRSDRTTGLFTNSVPTAFSKDQSQQSVETYLAVNDSERLDSPRYVTPCGFQVNTEQRQHRSAIQSVPDRSTCNGHGHGAGDTPTRVDSSYRRCLEARRLARQLSA